MLRNLRRYNRDNQNTLCLSQKKKVLTPSRLIGMSQMFNYGVGTETRLGFFSQTQGDAEYIFTQIVLLFYLVIA